MREHPLTPMTNPNLVELFGQQTKRRVGLAPYQAVRAGASALKKHLEELRAGGVQVTLIDCLDDEHLENICRAVSDLRLITGSSAFGMKLPAIWRERGLLDARLPVVLKSGNFGSLDFYGKAIDAVARGGE